MTGDAAVAVEQVTSALVLAAGGDDQVWPAGLFAEEIRARRAAHGLETTVLHEPDAGHRALLPGEAGYASVAEYAYGGTEEADRSLGARVLDAVLALV